MGEIGRNFQIELIEKIKPSISKNIADRNNEEKRLWDILNRTVNVNSIFTSLETLIRYLKVENRDEILKILNLDYSSEYFKYHMENYIIRISSIPDVLAWLANDVLNWGYTRNLYGTTLLKNDFQCSQTLKDKMSNLLSRIKDIRNKRHIKIHEGEVELPYFSDIVFFAEFPVEVSDLLKEHTEKGVNEQIESLETELDEIGSLVSEFMDELTSKL